MAQKCRFLVPTRRDLPLLVSAVKYFALRQRWLSHRSATARCSSNPAVHTAFAARHTTVAHTVLTGTFWMCAANVPHTDAATCHPHATYPSAAPAELPAAAAAAAWGGSSSSYSSVSSPQISTSSGCSRRSSGPITITIVQAAAARKYCVFICFSRTRCPMIRPISCRSM